MMLPNPRRVKPQVIRQDRLLANLQDEVTRSPWIVWIVVVTQRKIAKIHGMLLYRWLLCLEEHGSLPVRHCFTPSLPCRPVRPASVNGDDSAARVAAAVGGEKHHGRRHLVDRARPAERILLEQFLVAVSIAQGVLRPPTREPNDPLGGNRTWIDPHHSHAIAWAVGAQSHSHGHQAAVAHRTSKVLRERPLACGTDDVDDHPPTLRLHLCKVETRECEVAEHLQVPAHAPGS